MLRIQQLRGTAEDGLDVSSSSTSTTEKENACLLSTPTKSGKLFLSTNNTMSAMTASKSVLVSTPLGKKSLNTNLALNDRTNTVKKPVAHKNLLNSNNITNTVKKPLGGNALLNGNIKQTVTSTPGAPPLTTKKPKSKLVVFMDSDVTNTVKKSATKKNNNESSKENNDTVTKKKIGLKTPGNQGILKNNKTGGGEEAGKSIKKSSSTKKKSSVKIPEQVNVNVPEPIMESTVDTAIAQGQLELEEDIEVEYCPPPRQYDDTYTHSYELDLEAIARPRLLQYVPPTILARMLKEGHDDDLDDFEEEAMQHSKPFFDDYEEYEVQLGEEVDLDAALGEELDHPTMFDGFCI